MDQVGRYQIAGELGRGAMGVVYKALDPAIGRTVAIKTIPLAGLADASQRQSVGQLVLREAQAAGTMSHPNIVTVYDVLETNDFAYIVMEYVAGQSLEEMLRKRQLPSHEAILVFLRQVGDALDYAHRKGIIHRDVKPANILISEPGGGTERVAKIADFGVAKAVSQEITQSGTMTGTPNYMSPEQIQGRTLDGRSDQFSLAVVAYELLSGGKPFVAESLPALSNLICHGEPKPVEEVNPELSETVGKVMKRALAKEPSNRFGSSGNFVAALSIALAENQAAGGEAVKTAEPASGGGTVTRRRSEPEAGAAIAAENSGKTSGLQKLGLIFALCFAVAGAIIFIVRMNSEPPIPVQVLDTQSAPATPPPAEARVSSGAARMKAAKQVVTTPRVPQAKPARATQTPPPRASTLRADAQRLASRHVGQPIVSGGGVASVDLLSDPAGARIVVDSRSDETCTAPCTMSLADGRHTLIAQLDGFAVAKRIFSVPGASSLYIPLSESTGFLLVTSSPSGSTVVVDGRPYGQTPLKLTLSAGVHRVVLYNGSVQHAETLNIEPQSFQARSIRW